MKAPGVYTTKAAAGPICRGRSAKIYLTYIPKAGSKSLTFVAPTLDTQVSQKTSVKSGRTSLAAIRAKTSVSTGALSTEMSQALVRRSRLTVGLALNVNRHCKRQTSSMCIVAQIGSKEDDKAIA